MVHTLRFSRFSPWQKPVKSACWRGPQSPGKGRFAALPNDPQVVPNFTKPCCYRLCRFIHIIKNYVSGRFHAARAVYAEMIAMRVTPFPAGNAVIVCRTCRVGTCNTLLPGFFCIAIHFHYSFDAVVFGSIDKYTNHVRVMFPAGTMLAGYCNDDTLCDGRITAFSGIASRLSPNSIVLK